MIKKYIIINGSPIIFPNEVIHSSVVTGLEKVESAGFFFIKMEREETRKIICMGESTSLSIGSRPHIDQEILERFLQLNF